MISRKRTIRTFSPSLLLAAFSAAACCGAGAQNKALEAATATPLVGDMSTSAQVVGEPLHILVGRSMFVNTESRIRRIYVSNPDVLDSFTSSPRQIVVTAKTPGVSSVVLWDETGASHSYLINSDVDVTGLNKAIQDAFPSGSIRAEGHGAEVALTGMVPDTATSDAAFKLAGLYSKDVANSLVLAVPHIPQVKLKVRVVEIDRSRATQLGFNFFGNNGAHTFNTTTSQFGAVSAENSTTTTSGSSSSTTSAGASVSSLLELQQLAQSLLLQQQAGHRRGGSGSDEQADPPDPCRADSDHDQRGEGFVPGRRFVSLSPDRTGSGRGQHGHGCVQGLRCQGRLHTDGDAGGTISMKIAPEVSALDYSNAVVVSGYTLPAISTRRADTHVELRSGQSFVISGLLDNRTMDQMEKIPGIGDIPILGKLFQSKTTNHSVTELAIIVTPTVIDPLSEDTQKPVPQPKMVIPFLNSPKFDKELTPKTPVVQPQPNSRPEDVPVHD